MLSTVLLNTLAFLPQGGQGSSTAPVVINEFSYDDSSTDDHEYIELFNRSGAAVDVSGWSLVGDDSNGVNFTEVFPAGTIIAAGDYLVLGDTLVPNIDIFRASGFLQNSNESITLFDATGTGIVDTLIYEANKGVFNPALAEGEGIWGNFTLIEGLETSWSRLRDGYDTNNNGNDFRVQPWSPGTSNTLPLLSQTFDVFDGQTVGNDILDWQGSFVSPKIIDPALVDTNNPSVIPASPQGGLAAVLWDSSGGGDHAMQLSNPATDVNAEAYVYIDATPLVTGELEMWSFGYGTSGTFYNLPDPTTLLGFAANGDTGFVWTYVRDDSGGTIYLMDRNDGGMGASALSGPIVVGSIPIVAGVNDGWQRILLNINGTSAEGRFGGSFGAPDGTLFSATIASAERALYIGYREQVLGTLGARPFTFDFLLTTASGAAEAISYGTGCDGLTLTTTGVPAVDNAAFSLEVNNLTIPAAFVGFGTIAVNPGVDLTAVGMAGCFGYTNLNIGLFATGAVASGTGSFALPIPNSLVLIGSRFSSQGIALSAATTLGVASSNGVEIVIGY
ncbi:MAG: hypothetical protein ACI89X_000679 [Planctomycetota bacterium]|jgi:hypothetical protein